MQETTILNHKRRYFEKEVVLYPCLCYKNTFPQEVLEETVEPRLEILFYLRYQEIDVKREEHEPAQLVCPKCQHQIIVYLPLDDLPVCPECKQARMVIEELLDEGKAY